MKTLLIVISLISFAFPQSYARPDRPIVLSRKNLASLRDSTETRAIKNNIQKILSKEISCINCADIFENASNARVFIVVQKEPNGFGGSFVLVVFAKIPKLYRLWLYPIDKNKNEFEIREVIALKSLTNDLMNEITQKEYTDYWIHL